MRNLVAQVDRIEFLTPLQKREDKTAPKTLLKTGKS
jgi:hypothetical protein